MAYIQRNVPCATTREATRSDAEIENNGFQVILDRVFSA